MSILLRISLMDSFCLTTPVIAEDPPVLKPDPAQYNAAYEHAAADNWKQVLSDP